MKKHTSIILIILFAALAAQAQIIKTSLTLTIRDELGNAVEGATVSIFENQEDYTAEKNAAETGTTDAKGVIRFKNLKGIAYYVLARKGDKDNAGGGEQTGKLEEKKFNKATIVIQ
ncbi:MAG: carboxypeptidase regulatory-like domain-containing protein [Cyclobacteriaceae bacterium]|nr:carboxypeptidase regulatory-like domain-containing protein [Cyclobacteriaceae bacterium]